MFRYLSKTKSTRRILRTSLNHISLVVYICVIVNFIVKRYSLVICDLFGYFFRMEYASQKKECILSVLLYSVALTMVRALVIN